MVSGGRIFHMEISRSWWWVGVEYFQWKSGDGVGVGRVFPMEIWRWCGCG